MKLISRSMLTLLFFPCVAMAANAPAKPLVAGAVRMQMQNGVSCD